MASQLETVSSQSGPEDTVIGPVINESRLSKMLTLVRESRNADVRQVLGRDPQRLVLPPHVFADVRNDMPIAKYETFGHGAAQHPF